MLKKRLLHYEILEKVGAGGMGEVYRARDGRLGRDVALKVLPPEFSSEPERLKRFQNEARAVAALSHSSIVTIFSVEEAEGIHFITMELVKGSPLGDIIPPRGLSLERFRAIALPLTDALSSAHDVGIVHRDLKPSNVMVADENRVKILDFGLAMFVPERRPQSGDRSQTHTRSQVTGEGVVVGTLSYMSPEQLEDKIVDTRSDIFSLGIILYQMITGLHPFPGESAPAVMSSILRDTPTPAGALRGDLPVDLGRVISRCLEKEPKRRFQTARDVHNELADLGGAERGASGGEVVPFTRASRTLEASPPEAEPANAQGGFKHDLYISYAHLDNEAQLAGQEGWVSAFHRSLEVRVGQLLGKKPSIFRTPKSREDDTLDEGQIERLPASALLITVLSPRYIKSEWCTRELKEFLSASSRTGGAKWGSKYRVFKVIKTPTPVDRHPPELQPLLGYEFFTTDRETGRPRELDQIFGPEAQREYWARLDDLAHDLAEVLENAEPAPVESASTTSAGTPLVTPIEDSAGEGPKGSIYLAQTTHDLKDEHDALRRDFHRHGYTILPDQPLPLVESELKSCVSGALRRCRISVHLVGRNYGLVPEGATDSVIALQNEMAVERASSGSFNRLIWIPPRLEVADERQRGFIEQIRNDPRMQRDCDLLETPLEDLKTFVHQVLNPPHRKVESPARTSEGNEGDDVKRIYLICDQRDQDVVSPVADVLFERGFEVIHSVFEGDEAEVREDHEENMRLCDAVLLYYGAGNELWLRRKLREVQKSAGLGRTQPIRAKGIWIAPPATPQKERLRTREAVVMNQQGEFSADLLGPFFETIADGR